MLFNSVLHVFMCDLLPSESTFHLPGNFHRCCTAKSLPTKFQPTLRLYLDYPDRPTSERIGKHYFLHEPCNCFVLLTVYAGLVISNSRMSNFR